jgi:hypothetical protein
MDNFDLRKYLAEGKLAEGKLNEAKDENTLDLLKTKVKDDTLKPIGVISVMLEDYLSKNSRMYISRKDDKVYIIDDRGNIFASNKLGGNLIVYGTM